MRAVVAWFLSLFWFLFWYMFVYAQWLAISAGLASRAWPGTVGQISRTEIDSTIRRGGKGEGARRVYRPRLRYVFEVAGERFTGRCMHASELAGAEQWGSKSDAEAVAAEYPLGSEHPVFYDPAAPRRATLQVGTARGDWGFLLLFCCL